MPSTLSTIPQRFTSMRAGTGAPRTIRIENPGLASYHSPLLERLTPMARTFYGEVFTEMTDPIITPETCGASQVACNVVNEMFLSLDGFRPMRSTFTPNYPETAFAAELARIVDRELRLAR
jgi:hypothetical protein